MPANQETATENRLQEPGLSWTIDGRRCPHLVQYYAGVKHGFGFGLVKQQPDCEYGVDILVQPIVWHWLCYLLAQHCGWQQAISERKQYL